MSSPIYATSEELTDYLLADNQLEQASRVIDTALIGVVYEIDENGVATDVIKRDAIKKAVMAQVAYWRAGYGSPFGASIYSNVSIGSIHLGSSTKNGKEKSPDIAPAAFHELWAAGLIVNAPNTEG